MWRPRSLSPVCPSTPWNLCPDGYSKSAGLMGEVRSNLLVQAVKNTKVLLHPLLWTEELPFNMKAHAAGLWAHMTNGPLKRLSEESAGL